MCCFRDRVRKRRYVRDRNIAEKPERQMQVVFACPTGAGVWKCGAQLIDMFFDTAANVGRNFDRDKGAIARHGLTTEDTEVDHKFTQNGTTNSPERTTYCPGARITICFVALSTAALLNGSARGVTLRQSSNWSFQCGLFGVPDSPSGIPFCVLSQSLGSAMSRIETDEPTFTLPPEPFCGNGAIVNCRPIKGAAASG